MGQSKHAKVVGKGQLCITSFATRGTSTIIDPQPHLCVGDVLLLGKLVPCSNCFDYNDYGCGS
jgi:hypothetical protein